MRNTILVNKLLHLVQLKLFQIEASELEELSKQSQDEAIRLALILANHPAPPMPEFRLDSKYEDNEKLADLIDDVFKGQDDKGYGGFSYSYSSSSGKSKSSKSKSSESDVASLTDAEAMELCTTWAKTYNVITGVSWGNLPYDLQQKWLHYSCDYHLSSEGKSGSTPTTSLVKWDDEIRSQPSSSPVSSSSSSKFDGYIDNYLDANKKENEGSEGGFSVQEEEEEEGEKEDDFLM